MHNIKSISVMNTHGKKLMVEAGKIYFHYGYGTCVAVTDIFEEECPKARKGRFVTIRYQLACDRSIKLESVYLRENEDPVSGYYNAVELEKIR